MIQKISYVCVKHNEQNMETSIAYQFEKEGLCQFCIFEVLNKTKTKIRPDKFIDLNQDDDVIFFKAEIKHLINELKSSVEKLPDNTTLEGNMENQQKHGYFYYIFEDGTKQYAGKYNENLKDGFWYDFVCFNYQIQEEIGHSLHFLQMRKKILNSSFYVNGEKIHTQQVIGQQNIMFQKIGLNDQLIFQGEHIKNLKIGNWQILYNGDVCGGGQYDNKGQKFGVWTDVFEKYNSICQVQFKGEYQNNLRVGKWVIQNKNDVIGGGHYDLHGVKQGQWTEIVENFCDACQVTQCGDYKNGLRIGKWAISFQNDIIGGGSYDSKGLKQGQWIELCQNFFIHCQVTQSGEFLDGQRTGKWTTFFQNNEMCFGNYDQKGRKQGQWIDLHQSFTFRCQIICAGDYKNGLRVGKWITQSKNNEMGGGKYDEIGLKSGQWIELDDNFDHDCQVIYTGEYKEGLKIGMWITSFKNKKIGGGQYDEKGLKSGQWIDLDDNFNDERQVIYSGEYKDGLRVGMWNTLFQSNKIGGGNYNQNGLKEGEWIDLHKKIYNECQVTFHGEYCNGRKTGIWETYLYQKKIGHGHFNEKGHKEGIWTELHQNFSEEYQVTLTGVYIDGVRNGEWKTQFSNDFFPKPMRTVKSLFRSSKVQCFTRSRLNNHQIARGNHDDMGAKYQQDFHSTGTFPMQQKQYLYNLQ